MRCGSGRTGIRPNHSRWKRNTFYGSVVLSYANSHRDDPRVPEALHLVLRAVRYGCNDSQSVKTARDAFRFLHLNYPKSI